MDFSTWLNKKYIEFRGDSRATVSDFADFVDVPQSAMSKWMGKKDEKPGRKNLAKLAKKLGPSVYDVLGFPRPEPFDIPLDAVPPVMRSALIAATREIADTLAESKIDPDTPEAESLTTSIMEKHGFKWISTTRPSTP